MIYPPFHNIQKRVPRHGGRGPCPPRDEAFVMHASPAAPASFHVHEAVVPVVLSGTHAAVLCRAVGSDGSLVRATAGVRGGPAAALGPPRRPAGGLGGGGAGAPPVPQAAPTVVGVAGSGHSPPRMRRVGGTLGSSAGAGAVGPRAEHMPEFILPHAPAAAPLAQHAPRARASSHLSSTYSKIVPGPAARVNGRPAHSLAAGARRGTAAPAPLHERSLNVAHANGGDAAPEGEEGPPGSPGGTRGHGHHSARDITAAVAEALLGGAADGARAWRYAFAYAADGAGAWRVVRRVHVRGMCARVRGRVRGGGRGVRCGTPVVRGL